MLSFVCFLVLLMQQPANNAAKLQSSQDPADLIVISLSWKMVREESHPSTAWDEFGNARHPAALSPNSYHYKYDVKVRNIGGKAIKAVQWRYVFTTQTGQSSFEVLSKGIISPGHSKKLGLGQMNPPGPPRSGNQAGKPIHMKDLKEQVVILRIEYADGSAWKRSSD